MKNSLLHSKITNWNISLILLVLLSSLAAGAKAQLVAERATPSVLNRYDAQIDEIISKMTLDEKLAMFYGIRMFSSAGVPRLGIADFEYADGPFGIREELEANSWNPVGMGNDLATFFPTGSALAATWDPEIARKYGVAIGTEGRMRGKDMLLGPAINIQRLPVGGRTYEYFSEDPLLSALLSVGYTKGVQSVGLAVCLKHYALNNQENNRGSVNVVVSPRAMREIYFPPFEAAVKEADAWGVMAAYNKVNGWWCSENEFLLEKVLRGEWGFRGLVVSDWGGTHSTVNAIKNGLDVEMPNGTYLGRALIDSVKSGAVSEEIINQRIKDILRVRFHVKPVPASEANKTITSQPPQQQTAYEVASRSIVLLKNEKNLLPIDLTKVKSIAIIGDNAMQRNATGGVGAGVKTLYEITPYQGLKDRLGNSVKISFSRGYKGYSRFGDGQFVWGQEPPSPYVPADTALMKAAVKAASEADLVIFVGGTNREVETEGSDRTSIKLPSGQDELVQAIAKVNPNIVAVIVSGGPVDLNVVNQYSPSILMSWFNGSESGHALADVLLGKTAPSGRLPFTMPVKLEDSPAFALGNYPQGGAGADVFVNLVNQQVDEKTLAERNTANYSEELLVGYRWYDTKSIKPMFPFGHGLTYTSFAYSGLKTDKAKYNPEETVKISVNISNTGQREAIETVQAYVHFVKPKIFRPEKELKAFANVDLKAGETKTVTLEIPVRSLRYWDEKKYGWIHEKGNIEILIGASAGDIRLKTPVELLSK
jgi:beta-glucosidase